MKDHDCHCHSTNASVHQTLDELEFERGLWYASLQGDVERVTLLLKKGANPNAPDNNGYIPLHYAARAGHLEVCKLLLKGGSCVNVKTSGTLATPLHRAAYAGRLAIVELLLNHSCGYDCQRNCNNVAQEQDFEGKTCLHKAVEEKRWKVCECILQKNAAVAGIKDKHNKSPLDYVDGDLLQTAGNEKELNEVNNVIRLLNTF